MRRMRVANLVAMRTRLRPAAGSSRKQHLRARNDGPGDLDQAHLPAGEFVAAAVGEIFDADEDQRLSSAVHGFELGAPMARNAECDAEKRLAPSSVQPRA